MIFQYINVCPVPREMLKTLAYGLGFQHLPRDLGFQHLPRDRANVNAWKTMFDPYIESELIQRHDVKETLNSVLIHQCLPAGTTLRHTCINSVSTRVAAGKQLFSWHGCDF